MLNLLLISDSPKAEYIKGAIQPVLKVIIDVVTDFDHGLKDVFEKRPATVCIQDQIGGVTGESVARHIQMLLGNSAPKFILLHTGNGKARAIKGLYENLIDLSRSNETVAKDLINILKSLLGDQWEKIYIPPKQTPASVRLSAAIPEASRGDADSLVDDFLSDLETTGSLVGDYQHPVASVTEKLAEGSSVFSQFETPRRTEYVPGTVESDRAQAINDDLAELLLMEAHRAARDEKPATGSSATIAESEAVFTGSSAKETIEVNPPHPVVPESPALTVFPETSTGRTSSAKSAISVPGKKDTKTTSTPATATPPPAAEFRISHGRLPAEEDISEDLLLTFGENYRSESLLLRRRIVALVCVVCAAGGFYFVKQKPDLVDSLKRRLISSTAAKQAPATVSVPVPVQKPLPAPVLPPVVTPPLPAFIPKDDRDSTFAVRKPGWERYVGKRNEYRVFSNSGRIQAVQVLAVKDVPISESLIKSVLQEFVGSQEYQITSQSTKAGVRIENGRIQNKGEVKIYRKNGAIKAFVVSVN